MTHSPCSIIAERAIFLLSEMADGAERIIFVWTNRPNAAFESSKILPVSQLHYFQETTTNRHLSGRRHTSTFMRSITFVGWMSSFLTSALSCHSKLHLKRRSSRVHCCLVLFLFEMPFFQVNAFSCWEDVLPAYTQAEQRRFLSLSKLYFQL